MVRGRFPSQPRKQLLTFGIFVYILFSSTFRIPRNRHGMGYAFGLLLSF
jgi:hypothetical protein